MKTKKIFAALTAVCLSAQAAGLTVFAETIVPDEGTDGSSSASTQPAGTTVPDPTNTSPVSPEPAEPVTPPAAPRAAGCTGRARSRAAAGSAGSAAAS